MGLFTGQVRLLSLFKCACQMILNRVHRIALSGVRNRFFLLFDLQIKAAAY